MSDSTENKEHNLVWITDLVIGFISLGLIIYWYHGMSFNTEKARAKSCAKRYFKTLCKPSAENYKKWGLKEFRIVGHYALMARSIAGAPKADKIKDKPLEYAVTIPCCCRGKDLKGEDVYLLRHVRINIKNTVVTGFSFTVDRPLRLWDRLKFWGYSTFILPIVVFGVVFVSFIIYTSDLQLSLFCAPRGTRFVGTVNSAYVSYVCWQSILLSIVCTLLYAVLHFSLILLSGYILNRYRNENNF